MTKIIDLQNQCGEPVNNIESINVSQNEFSESINLSQLLLMKASQCIFESKPLQLEARTLTLRLKRLKALDYPKKMDNKINVPVLLKVLGEADLSGAGCGSSASPVLRRGQLK